MKLMLLCVLRGELCRCGYFTASLHCCCSFNRSVSLVNIYVTLSDCLKSMLLVWILPYRGLLSCTCTLKNKTLQPNAEIPWEGWRQRVLITLSFLEPPSSQKSIFIGLWKHNCLFLGIGTLSGSIVLLATKQLILTTWLCPPCLVPGPHYSGQY